MTYNLSEEKNPKYFISWGLGVQSTALSVMSLNENFDIRKVDYIISADTMWEKSLTYQMRDYYLKYFSRFDVPIYIVSDGNIRKDNREHKDLPLYYGRTGAPLRRQCTSNYKIYPIRRKIRELLGLRLDNKGRTKKNSAILYLGISYDEADRMSISNRTWIKNEYPLVDLKITRNDCIEYLKSKNLPVPPKSACIGCPYTSSLNWKWLKECYPNEFQDAVEFDKEIRISPKRMIERGFDAELFLHKSLLPLDEVDFDKYIKEKDDSCGSGYCFI